MVVLQPVGEERRLLVELFSTHFTLKRSFVAKGVDLHVVVETSFFVRGVIAVSALVFLFVYHILVVILSVALEETA